MLANNRQLKDEHDTTITSFCHNKASVGAAMDTRIENKRWSYTKLGIIAVVILAGISLVYASTRLDSGSRFRLEQGTLNVASVKAGTFEDYIPVRGRITPRTTVYLDSTEGGRIDQVYVEDGALVAQGELILSLSNSALQLSVTNAEAQVAEQLNNMRSNELALEQNRLRSSREILDIEYRIQTLNRELEGEQRLLNSGAISERAVREKKDELAYQEQRLVLGRESQITESKLQQQQLQSQKITGERLEQNLEVARKNLDDLNVRAPFTGKLSGFDAEVGQTINRGGRIGQIDVPDEFKLQATLDEFYLNRIDIGQLVNYQHGGKDYQAEVKKIYPQVNNGKFEIDIIFMGDQPEGLRRGQTLQAKLTLGDEAEALLIPNGAFFQDTGGHWIFVLNADGTEAIRRPVVLGRRNISYIEVLEGLENGEQVVISSYGSFEDIDRLVISEG